ncbi:MAG: deoxyribodipyrimidine photo-lyase [Patescibacteria group bacterium]|nr:MAG: deoxyribodipyrimidine photo-lyase [Patescibacteria group bacterium]
MRKERVRKLNTLEPKGGEFVLYWMSRDQRASENWALLYAQELAQSHNVPLVVVFALSEKFLGATLRQYDFMLKGLEEVQKKLQQKGVPFILLHGKTKVPQMLEEFCVLRQPLAVVMDFSPLRIGRQWREYLAKILRIPCYEVDAHNVIPAWRLSDHQEFAAHTIRPKIHALIDEYLEDYPELVTQAMPDGVHHSNFVAEEILRELDLDRTVQPVTWLTPGETAAADMFEIFLGEKLEDYNGKRNDPNADAQSNLSPYLHFGQISAQKVVQRMMAETGKRLRKKLAEVENGPEAFLEELVVRRELADNFCLYNANYDRLEGALDWARNTLTKHEADHREHLYTLSELENGQTHDPVWNAAQAEMCNQGKMHGYLRMYWAKKILEWTSSPVEALEYAIYLNDRYELDGRDPNGYVGIMWSICGVHDRPWFERPVFGSIRYMNAQGLKNKFDTAEYVARNA